MNHRNTQVRIATANAVMVRVACRTQHVGSFLTSSHPSSKDLVEKECSKGPLKQECWPSRACLKVVRHACCRNHGSQGHAQHNPGTAEFLLES